MGYCQHCGEKLPDNSFFCPKCGTKTAEGMRANASSPSDELRDAFNRMSVELERAFGVAATELRQAFQTARDNVQKSVNKAPVVCPNCGETNSASAAFCTKCGKNLSEKSAST